MIFRPIILRKIDDKNIEFRPENIQEIVFEQDIVILQYWQDIPYEEQAVQTTKFTLKKEDYYYPHWRSFINQLNRTFDIKEINYE